MILKQIKHEIQKIKFPEKRINYTLINSVSP